MTGTVHSWSCSDQEWTVSDAGPTSKLCQNGQDWDWDCPTERWVDDGSTANACYVNGNNGYVYDQWSYADCEYTASSRPKPTNLTACQSASWTSCAWSVADNAPEQPDDTACGPATLNSSCVWVAATAPSEPNGCPAVGYANSFTDASCSWGSAAVAECGSGFTPTWQPSSCLYTCTPIVRQSCSEFAQPTSRADCTAEQGINLIPAHGFRLKADGWYGYRNASSISGGTVIPASEWLCVSCDN